MFSCHRNASDEPILACWTRMLVIAFISKPTVDWNIPPDICTERMTHSYHENIVQQLPKEERARQLAVVSTS